MKRIPIGLAALVVVCGAVALPSFAGNRERGRTIDLTGVMTSDRVVVDVKPAGYSAGDIGYVVGKLSEKGKPTGRYHGVCFTIANNSSQCSFTVGLPDGQLVLQASYGPGFNTGSTALEPVVGGTGAYEGARGVVHDTEVDNTHLRIRVELLP